MAFSEWLVSATPFLLAAIQKLIIYSHTGVLGEPQCFLLILFLFKSSLYFFNYTILYLEK